MKRIILFIMLILVLSTSVAFADEEYIEPLMENAIVLEAGEEEQDEMYGEYIQFQNVKIRITSGKYKDEVLDIENVLPENLAYRIFVEKGDKIVVMIEENESGYQVYVADYSRMDYIKYLTILFVVLILIIGKMKGLKSIISLTLTIGSVFYILLPQILKGANPIPISILISIGVTIITIFLVSGINSKGIAAIVGTSAGVIIAGLISYYVGYKIHLTGLSAEEATMLMYIPQNITFNFKNLLFSGIILGSLGAIMDVGMSISSSIEEIHNANNSFTTKELFKSGMNVGKDVMGTMTNTLILAYTGASIPLLLLFMAYETSLVKVLNLDIIATEIIRSLSGSIGLVLTIPITAFVASVLIKKQKLKGEDLDE